LCREELWQELPKAGAAHSVMSAPYPEPLPALRDEEVEARMARMIEVTRAIRNLRAEMKVAPRDEVQVTLRGGEPPGEDERRYVAQAARAELLLADTPPDPTVAAAAAGYEVVMGLP